MTVAGGEAIERPEARGDERRAAGVACGAHALHDGYTDLIVLMLPIWQAEFGLGYGELGLMRGLFAGTMAAFQIPAGLVAERLGTPLVLAGGTALAGAETMSRLFTTTNVRVLEAWTAERVERVER